MGMNHMSDWTNDEYKKLLGYRRQPLRKHNHNIFDSEPVDAPASFDWRTHGAVTPVKNQAQCGSCWSFSATGSMEGAYQIAGNTLTSFSEQQFVDCSGKFGNQGCNGGLMDDAFEYAETVKIETEAAYPYTARDGTCHAAGGVTEVKGYQDVAANSPTALQAALLKGPVSIAIDAAGIQFQLYFGGVMRYFCGTSLDHGVLLVGYGTSKGMFWDTDYWLVKNSWGSGWGESGYFKLYRDMKTKGAGTCGLQMQASYPTF